MVKNTSEVSRRQLWRERFKEGDLERYELGGTYLKGSKIDTVFDLLGTFSFIQGAAEMERMQHIERIERDFADDDTRQRIEFAKVPPASVLPLPMLTSAVTDPMVRETLKYAITHKIEPSDVHQDKFVSGLGRNIAMDPTSWIPSGAIKGVARSGSRGLVSRLPTVAQRPIYGGIAQFERGAEIIGAGKTAIKNKALTTMGAGYGWVGASMKRARDTLGEMFEPGYKIKQLGPAMSEFYDDYMDMVASRRGRVQQAFHEVKQLGTSYKRAGTSAMTYIEKGVSTGVEGLDKYLDDVVKPYISDLREKELAAGYDVGLVDAYAPHVLSDKGMELLEKHGDIEGVVKFLKNKAQVAYGKERELPGSAEEINKLLGGEYFMEDLWESIAVRAQRSAKDRATTSWLKGVETKYGLNEAAEVVENVATKAATLAQEQINRNRRLVQPFERAVQDIASGQAPARFLSNVVDAAASGPLRGGLPRARQLVSRLNELGTQKDVADRRLRDLMGDVTTYTSTETLELLRGGDRATRMSREVLEHAQEMVADASGKIPQAEDVVARKVAGLRAEAMQIQSDIIDPAHRRISRLQTKAAETKTVRVAKAAVDDLAGYSDTVRDDITKKLPTEMAKFMDELEEVPTERTIWNKIDEKHSWIINKWKKGVTLGYGPFIHKAFFGRNVGTGTLQNVQEIGVAKTLRGMVAAVRMQYDIGTFKTKEFGEVSADEMQKLMRESGQMGGTGRSDVEVAQHMFPTAYQKFIGLGGRAMEWTEAMVREPLFIESMRTKTLRATREVIKKTQFDYSPEALTPFEQTLKRYAIPFYTFERFNIKRQIGKLFEAPKHFDRYGKVQRESLRVADMEEEYEQRPEWQQNMYMLPNPIRTDSFVTIPTGITSVTAETSPYGMLTPLKSILEYAAITSGYSSDEYKERMQRETLKKLFLGRYRSNIKRTFDMEMAMSDKLMHDLGMPVYDAAESSVSMEEFEQYRYRMVDPTKGQEFEAWQKAGRPKGFKVMRLGERVGGIGVETDTVIEAPWWKFWQKDEVIPALRHQYELGIVTPEIYEMGQGYPWTQAKWDQVNKFEGAARGTAIAELVVEWDEWKAAQYGVKSATVEQQMTAWVRAGKPSPAIDRVYRDDDGNIIGVGSFDKDTMDEISEYINKGVQLSDAEFEWAFLQEKPTKWIAERYRKADQARTEMLAAREELRGFNVDKPASAAGYNTTEMNDYSAYRKGRIDHEQDLIEKAMSRGETQ